MEGDNLKSCVKEPSLPPIRQTTAGRLCARACMGVMVTNKPVLSWSLSNLTWAAASGSGTRATKSKISPRVKTVVYFIKTDQDAHY